MRASPIIWAIFKAIELDQVSKRRTGREHMLAAETRQAAVDALLDLLNVSRADAHIDPSRTLVQAASQLWTIVGFTPPTAPESPSLRRAGAKHKRVR